MFLLIIINRQVPTCKFCSYVSAFHGIFICNKYILVRGKYVGIINVTYALSSLVEGQPTN